MQHSSFHSDASTNTAPPQSLIAFHLLGTVDFDACLALQTRLVYEASGRDDDRTVVLLVEHPPLITIGRSGSRGHVRLTESQLRRQQLTTRWVSRGGGCVLHQPGQLAVYPIVPLERRGWLVGEYLTRFKTGLVNALSQLNIRGTAPADSPGIHGRSGVLASVGIGVRNWVGFHGAWLNVNPPQQFLRQIDAIPPENAAPGLKTTLGSLLAERQEPVTMSQVRAALIEQLALAFDCPRQHVHSGHPLYSPPLRDTRERAARRA
ncbi:MAG TPA: hypothetical protein VL096_06000 [Pirellulaceae bacterium]|nr:hypothetical protein [Pirellulaceae bacterium]